MNAQNPHVRFLQKSLEIISTWARIVTLAVTLAGATCLCGAIQGAETEIARAPQTYYVAPTGSDDNDGTTQAKPWQTIS